MKTMDKAGGKNGKKATLIEQISCNNLNQNFNQFNKIANFRLGLRISY